MKVLLGHVFYRTSSPSGEDVVYRNEKQLLLENGVEVISFEKHNDELRDDRLSDKLVNAKNCIWSESSRAELKALLEQHKPDIAHFHNTFPQMSSSVYAACQDTGVPVVQTLHNYRSICPNGLLQRQNKPCEDCLQGSLLPALRHRCYRDSLLATSALVGNITMARMNGSHRGRIHRYIALTEFAKSRLAAGGLPAERISVKPNFLDAVAATTTPKENYAIYIGRLSQEKGVHTLIEAWRQLPAIPLKIVGDGPLRETLETIVQRERLPVQFLGQRSKAEVLALVGAARLQLIPSECYEGFPMVLLEAFAMGTPVFASRIGSLAEIIAHGDSGFFFEPGAPDSLAKTVARHWDDTDTLDNVAIRARALYHERYTPATNFKQLMDIYTQVLADQGRTEFYKPQDLG